MPASDTGIERVSRPPVCSRRAFLGLTSAAVGLLGSGATHRAWAAADGRHLEPDDPDLLPPFERLHLPVLRLPIVAGNGAKVPVTVEMTHPMEPGHYISAVRVVNPRDPIPSKGVYYFSPANGRAAVSFQARMDQGRSEVSVTAECNLHGPWSSTRSINVADGAGGCAAPAPAPSRVTEDEIRPPAIRIPTWLKGGRIRPDDVVRVELETRHPNRTGLGFRDGKFVQESEPFHLKEIEVFYGQERVSRFEGTPALSDDEFIGFWLRVPREGLLRALLTNNRGQRFEAARQIRFS
jgi:desulfoferrodoxin (superoxide reductase-like protein)